MCEFPVEHWHHKGNLFIHSKCQRLRLNRKVICRYNTVLASLRVGLQLLKTAQGKKNFHIWCQDGGRVMYLTVGQCGPNRGENSQYWSSNLSLSQVRLQSVFSAPDKGHLRPLLILERGAAASPVNLLMEKLVRPVPGSVPMWLTWSSIFLTETPLFPLST